MARDVCQQLGLSIADKSQVKYALDRGFETCKYDWQQFPSAVRLVIRLFNLLINFIFTGLAG